MTIPAFIAAYTGQRPEQVSLDPFKTRLAPNWRVSYDGLSKGNLFKNRVKRFSLNHSYRSTMTTSYVTNLSYEADDLGRPTASTRASSATMSTSVSTTRSPSASRCRRSSGWM